MKFYTIGVDITSKDIRAVKVERSWDKRLKIVAFAQLPVSGKEDTLSKIKELEGMPAFREGRFIINFPASVCSFQFLSFPFSSHRLIEQALPSELETRIPFRLNEMVWDYKVFHRPEGGSHVFVMLVPRKVLHDYLTYAAVFDPRRREVDISSFSQVACLMGKGKDKEGVFLSLDSDFVTMVFFAGGELIQFRCFPKGDEKAFLDNLKIGWETFLLWTGSSKKVVDMFVSTQEEDPAHWEILKSFSGCRIHMVDLSSYLKVEIEGSLKANWSGTIYNEALALAVRPFFSKTKGFCLLPPNVTAPGYNWTKKQVKSAICLIGLIFLMMLVELMLNSNVLDKRIELERKEIRTLVSDVSGELSHSPSPLALLKGKLEDAKNVSEMIKTVVAEPSFLSILHDISTLPPPETQFVLHSLTYSRGKVLLKGEAKDFSAVEKVRGNLSHSSLFSRVNILNSRVEQEGQRISLEMEIYLRKGI